MERSGTKPSKLLQMLEKLGGMNWFGEQFEGKPSSLARLEYLRDPYLTGEQHDLGGRVNSANGESEFDPVHLRHQDIGEKVVGIKARGGVESRPAVVGGESVEARDREDLAKRIGDPLFVVYDKDSAPRRLRAESPTPILVSARCWRVGWTSTAPPSSPSARASLPSS